MQFVVDDEDFTLLAREAEPGRPRSDREREVGDEPRLSRLRRRDDVHRLAPAQEAVYQHGLHLRVSLHQLSEGQELRRALLRFRLSLSSGRRRESAEVDGLLRHGLPVALGQQLPRRPRVVPAALQGGIHLEAAVAAFALERRGVRGEHEEHVSVERRRVAARFLAWSPPQFVSVGLVADMLPAVRLQDRTDFASPAEVVARPREEIAAVARHGPCVRSGGRSRPVARPAP